MTRRHRLSCGFPSSIRGAAFSETRHFDSHPKSLARETSAIILGSWLNIVGNDIAAETLEVCDKPIRTRQTRSPTFMYLTKQKNIFSQTRILPSHTLASQLPARRCIFKLQMPNISTICFRASLRQTPEAQTGLEIIVLIPQNFSGHVARKRFAQAA